MTTFARPVQTGPVAGPGGSRKGSPLASWLSTTDHKIIGHLYLIPSFGLFLIAGLMAVIIRAQLFGPDDHIVSDQQYNELFTMHGTIMLLLFATPLFLGLANESMPLQIDSPDVAFPRLNILSYYFFVPAAVAQLHPDTADPARAARVRPALLAHPDRLQPCPRPAREHPAPLQEHRGQQCD